MAVYLVTFKDKGNCEILDKTIAVPYFHMAIMEAQKEILKANGDDFAFKLEMETDTIIVERLD